MVVFGPTVILPQYVQGVLGFTATLSGLLLLMRALPVIFLTPVVARLTSQVDVRLLLVLGFAISSTSFALVGLRMTPVSDFDTFAGVLVLSGIGQAMLLVSLLVGVLGSVPAPDAPKASSFISLSVQLGGSIASTMLVTVLDRRTSFHSDIYRHTATLANPLLRHDPHAAAALAQLARILQRQATNTGFADAIFTLVPLAAAATLLALLLKRPSTRQTIPVAAAD